MGHAPSVLGGYQAYTEGFQGAKMSPRLRGLLTAAIAELSGCDYVLSHAYVLGPREGLTLDEVTAARRLESSDQRVAAALRFAAQVIESRGHVAESEVRKLQASYTDEEIVEIVGFIGLTLVRVFFNLALGTAPDVPLPKEAGNQDRAPAGQTRASG